MTETVRTFLHAFERMVNECDLMISGSSSAWAGCLDDVPWKDAKASDKLLMAMLRSVSKAKELTYV